MENASKALLIAGAVLLVIAIIAIGMGIFGTARGVVNQAEGQIDNMSIQMHNKQFELYQKDTLTGEEVKELVSLVISNNKKSKNSKFMVELECSDEDWNNYVYLYENDIYSYNEYTDSDTEVICKFSKLYKNITFNYSNKGIISSIYIYG